MKNYKRNVVILIPRIDNSGPVKGALAFGEMLKNHGHEVEFISLHPLNKKEFLYKNFNKHKLSTINVTNFFIPLISPLIRLNNHLSIYNKNDVKIISFCLMPDIFNVLLFRFKDRTIFIRGNIAKNYLFENFLLGFFKFTLHFILIMLIPRALFLNKSLHNFFSKINKRSHLFPNFISENKKLPIKKSNNRFIFVGGLNKRKNVLNLVDVFINYKFSRRLELYIFGDGPLRERLLEAIKVKGFNNIKYMGFESDINKIYNHGDYFILPSLAEGVSRASMEALYYGLPIIIDEKCYDNCNLINKINGVILKNGDIKLAVSKILKIKPSNKSLLPSNYSANSAYKLFEKIFIRLDKF